MGWNFYIHGHGRTEHAGLLIRKLICPSVEPVYFRPQYLTCHTPVPLARQRSFERATVTEEDSNTWARKSSSLQSKIMLFFRTPSLVRATPQACPACILSYSLAHQPLTHFPPSHQYPISLSAHTLEKCITIRTETLYRPS